MVVRLSVARAKGITALLSAASAKGITALLSAAGTKGWSCPGSSEAKVYKLPPPLQNDVHIVSSGMPASSSATDTRV